MVEMFLSKLAFSLLNGAVWGLIVSLIALGLTLIFGLMGIINIAHGDLYMFGAFLSWYIINYTGNYWLSYLVPPLLIGLLGLFLEKEVLRPFEDRPEYTVIATIAIGYILQHIALAIFGGSTQVVRNPVPASLHLFGIEYPVYRLFAASASLLLLTVLWLILYRTTFGLWIRATMQDKEIAETSGIPVNRVCMVTFALGCFLSALGGSLAAPIVQISYLMGFDVLVLAFIVVVVGGLGSLKGALVTSLLISILENVLSIYLTPLESRLFSLALMVAILVKKPTGIFGRQTE